MVLPFPTLMSETWRTAPKLIPDWLANLLLPIWRPMIEDPSFVKSSALISAVGNYFNVLITY